MSDERQTAWREGDRIRATNGTGYADMVSDYQIRSHLSGNDPEHDAFALAVLAIRAYERVARRD